MYNWNTLHKNKLLSVTLKRSVQLLCALFLLAACRTEEEKTVDKPDSAIQSEPLSTVSDSVQMMVDLLSSSRTLYTEAVGEAGEKTETYIRFERLKQIASDTELIALMEHRSPVVRAYVFSALVQRRNPDIKDILMKHVDDTVQVECYSGCFRYDNKLNEIMLLELKRSRNTRNSPLLSERDIAEIEQKMK